MKTYLVGGAVRDHLLGRPAGDKDWVVVGATPEMLVEAGFVQVGSDFPVFHHPVTREEYALARTERKTALGYRGFVVHSDPSVTLEEDLGRRDLTINAMAMDERGVVTDLHGGERDLRAGILRHVSPAFHEDPVRILRVARFAARHPSFSVAAETMAMMTRMVAAGEVNALVPERVWQELARGLMEVKPSRMFEVLRECGALKVLLPELDALWGVPQPEVHHPEIDTGVHVMMVLDEAAKAGASLAVRYACLCHDLGKGQTPADILPRHHQHEMRSAKLVVPMSRRFKVPSEHRELAILVAREHGNIHASLGLAGTAILRLLDRCDAIRRPERFALALEACECDARGRLGLSERPYPQRPRLLAALELVRGFDTTAEVARLQGLGHKGKQMGDGIHAARVQALNAGFDGLPHPPATLKEPAAAARPLARRRP
ncbi:tRNA nucleotidyltransferase (CCA-adding enzyme) [Roseateles asaccharophilus]|uniref:multifunctional CCA addition/repair protein n=1 Tax=Roseateles asaccharophilus TaxID=582607 RepID=UPI003832BCE6